MSSTQHEIEKHRANDEDKEMSDLDSAAAGLSDNDGFLVPSPVPTRRTRTYSQYVIQFGIVVARWLRSTKLTYSEPG